MAGSHGHILRLSAHGQVVNQALSAEYYAVAVHGHILVAALESQLAQFGDVHTQTLGRQLQKPARGSGADSAHGKASRNSVLNRDGLVVHPPDINNRGRPSLGVGQKDSSLGVDCDLLLHQLGVDVLAHQKPPISGDAHSL